MSTAETTTNVDYGHEEAAMRAYREAGEARAYALPNRGPVRYDETGAIHLDILESYWRHGFYVFEGVLRPEELVEIEADFLDILDRLPTGSESAVDATGRPALGLGNKGLNFLWSKPLGDPFGGTELANGRHPVKMTEPAAAADAPKEVVISILGMLQFSEAYLRACGHPDLLAVAAAVNGDDFLPFNESLLIKQPGLGGSFAWHQDGVTHWDSPDWHQGSHGFNFMGQLYGSTPANGVWVVPGTHAQGRQDIRARIAEAGSERLPDAVPIVCGPGDVAITNRQALHASFANTSADWRVTVNFGFHPRASVFGVLGGGIHSPPGIYDEARIRTRGRFIGYAIDARSRRFPDETPYVYQPYQETGEHHVWDDEAKAGVRDYNLMDFSI